MPTTLLYGIITDELQTVLQTSKETSRSLWCFNFSNLNRKEAYLR